MRTPIILAMLLAPTPVLAGGYFIPNATARDLALSQSAIANETGAEAVVLNTSALADQQGLDVSGNGMLLINRTDWSDPTLGSASLDTKVNTPVAVGVSYGDSLENQMRWGAGLGFTNPAGGRLQWPTGWPGQQVVQSVDQKVYAFTAGGAFQPVPYVNIGARYIRYQGTEEIHQEINFLDHFGDAGLGMSGGANSFGFSGEVHVPTIPLTLGVDYVRKVTATITGNAHFTDVPPAFQPMLHDQGVHQDVVFPTTLDIGAAYKVIPDLTVMATFSWEAWSVYHADTFIGDAGLTITVPRDYNDAEVYRVGGEWVNVPFLPPLTLRLGFLRSISDQPTTTVSPTLTDGDSWAVSVGAGYNVMPSLRVDLGYQHAWFDDVTASGPDAFPGTYKTRVDLISLGVNWRTDLCQ